MDSLVLTTVISPQLKRILDEKLELKSFEAFKNKINSELGKLKDLSLKKGRVTPDLSQSFQSHLNFNNTSDLLMASSYS